MKKVSVLGANGYIARNLIYVLKRDYPDFELALYGREKQFVDGEGNYCVIDMTDAESVKSIDLDGVLGILDVILGKQYLVNALQRCKSLGNGISGL